MNSNTTPRILLPLVAAIALLAGLPATADAQAMNYQGRLTDNDGKSLTALSATLTFNLWNHPTNSGAGDKLWGPFTVTDADLVGGRFNVVLGPLDGANRNIAAALTTPQAADVYLHMTVTPLGGATNAALPRQQLFSTPRALSAAEASHALVADNFVSTVLFTDETNQRVGIGIANPSVDLEVVGDSSISGNLNVGGITTSLFQFTFLNSTVGGDASIGGAVSFGTTSKLSTSNAASLGLAGTGEFKFKPDGNDPGILLESNLGGESSGLFMNGDTTVMWNPGDGGLLNIYDEDDFDNQTELQGTIRPEFRVVNNNVQFDRYTPASGVANESIHNSVGSLQEESLRIVRGAGTANIATGGPYNPIHGRGFTYNRIAQGVCDVRFDVPFAGTPSVTANTISSGSVFCNFTGIGGTGNPTSVGFRIICFDTGGNGRDWPWNFIAIGPR